MPYIKPNQNKKTKTHLDLNEKNSESPIIGITVDRYLKKNGQSVISIFNNGYPIDSRSQRTI